VLHFELSAAEKTILVRTGISGVSSEGAAKNLQAEQNLPAAIKEGLKTFYPV